MRNKREIEILTNVWFLALNNAERLMSIEESIKSKTSQANTSENRVVVMLDHPGNRSNAFDMQIAEPMFEFCHSLLIPITINTSQRNCWLGNTANVLHIMGDKECEVSFRMNMDRH